MPTDAMGSTPLREGSALLYKPSSNGGEQSRGREIHAAAPFTQSQCNLDCIMNARQALLADNIAAAYIARAKDRFGVQSDEQLAEKLSVAKSTIASWRRRGVIPYSVYEEMHYDGIDYIEFFYGYMAEKLAKSQAGEIFIILLAMRFGRVAEEGSLPDWAEWIFENRLNIFRTIMSNENSITLGEKIDEAYVQSKIMTIYRKIATSDEFASEILRKAKKDYGLPPSD